MSGSFRIGRIAGIDISLHLSWVIIAVLLTWSLATGWFATLYPGWITSAYRTVSGLATLLLFGSVLANALAHSLVARARGLSVKNITLFIECGKETLGFSRRRNCHVPAGTRFLAFLLPFFRFSFVDFSHLICYDVRHETETSV